MKLHPQSGVSLIEVLIGVAILGVVAGIGVPSFRDFIANSQIRTVAESLRNGLQLARAEAVKRNALVSFTLNANTSWVVGCVTVTTTCPASIQTKSATEGSSSTVTITMMGSNAVRFTSLGTVDASVPGQLSQINIDSTSISAAQTRDLQITIGTGGNARVCDPNVLATGDSRKC